ncbi:MAG: acetyl-CoA carboxylase biotin carboxylase subunit [Candidatus Lambdaproteobacteria bacterium RIFOXYD2_FULL_50_16]|uniref:Biotin carboxylase n=1 Tax=Candidatus Lambdaproteobacteria bacterium RIFOXYD2_FULL_50_16 TaxID=1817772 RepID=A0A1F6GD82_9PROT|nr:MAG: acetyl-CoA carboxylase biotin carboxylase subunit [Candidatus Lambdaproteobacteria bacterium RIFOXYD2_FULL_50_16]
MYKKILIANRGEIAIRIIRACREMGIKTVTVHSTADRDSLHVKMADESLCIGEAKSADSYLNIPRIIAAAEITGAEAIHPGYGFLSEKADFVEMCQASGIDFIGPSAEVIHSMGDKINARKAAELAGCPCTPGTKEALKNVEEVRQAAEKIGFPVILKASAGGGGRGMRIVRSMGGLINAYETAKAEAYACFGNDDIFLEKYIERPRHVEIQLLGDKHGNVIHLGDRDCSIQRRNQKIIEEAPAPGLSAGLRKRMGESAVAVAKAVGYYSAGTIEFLVDKDENFYFMEMNTRLQVEHPVTEAVTGVDLVREMILVATGEKLTLTQKDIKIKGHAIECRINAEDPATFVPSPGLITAYHAPGGLGVRVDSAAYQGWNIPPYYDSMIAKVIAYSDQRSRTIQKLIGALEETVIEGVKVNIPLHLNVLRSLRFQEAELSTAFLENFIKS